MSEQRDKLKSLLLHEELQLLDKLKHILLSKQQFTEEVAKVLTAAIKTAQKRDKEFEQSLKAPIKRGVNQALLENKQALINGLMPIMGQLIRKTVSNSLKQFVADINRTLELGFSAKAVKWRWQAFKSGQSFADIVFHNTIEYQITEMFVINHDNGLLVQHVGTDTAGVLKNPDALSAMLTVLQDFIGESVQTSDSGLMSVEISDRLFLISTGPSVYLASVIKGSPTERLKQRLQQLIENIHADFSELIADHNQYQNNTEFASYLENHLITKSLNESEKNPQWKAWVFILLVLTIGLSYWQVNRNQNYQKIWDVSHSIAGLYVKDIHYKNGNYHISGLVDPMADMSLLESENILLDTQPFISLEHTIIEKKVQLLLQDFPTIQAQLKGKTLTITGEVDEKDIDGLIQKLENTPGIEHIIKQIGPNIQSRVNAFIWQHENIRQHLNYNHSQQQLSITGIVEQNIYQDFIQEFNATFPHIKLNTDASIALETLNQAITFIQTNKINIPKLHNAEAEETDKLTQLIEQLRLVQKFKPQSLSLVGESDCFGQKSNAYSLQRAEHIRQILIKNQINFNNLSTKIVPCVTFNSAKNDTKKNVFLTLP